LEVSPHDPYVQFAADASGYGYSSNTRGEVWHEIEGLPHVKDFLFSCDYPWIAFAATDGGIYRTHNGGDDWSQVCDEPMRELLFDPDNSHVLYAVGPTGIYKSADLGEADMGAAWRCVGAKPTNAPQCACAIAAIGGEPVTLYMLTRNGFYTKTVNDPEWSALPQTKRVRGFSEVDPIGGRPLWLRADPLVPARLFRAIDLRYDQSNAPTISVSDDAGRTWTPVIRELKPLAEWHNATYTGKPMPDEELRRLVNMATTDPITDLRVDRNAPDVWYGLTKTGIAVTEDAGKTWRVNNEGLDIVSVEALWTPRHAKLTVVGTPAGMYVSNDRGRNWTDTSLILQFEGAMRYEIGGIGYLTAYWMGRYHGFISEQQAVADWSDKPATPSNP
jgi:photosystem II stability/assembly factor-like uncharacterized protein